MGHPGRLWLTHQGVRRFKEPPGHGKELLRERFGSLGLDRGRPRTVSAILATVWDPLPSLYSGWLAAATVVSALACCVASLRQIRSVLLGQVLVMVGAPILFVTVLFSEAGLMVLKDGREFGFSI